MHAQMNDTITIKLDLQSDSVARYYIYFKKLVLNN